ncbi:hypothetical protein [Nitratireductor basaltis]|uniref:hypothetical protein n=1 Tax=Nitratireductor basaltis TaxID=472175 RepID=UPI00068BE90E|nr:hypothetical protein [Nitratireductor basaltis]
MKTDRKNESPNHASRPHVAMFGRSLPLPQTRLARMGVGSALVVLGMFGFLPVLGFWMIPLGLLVLSYDFASVRRMRRRSEVWWNRKRQKTGKKVRGQSSHK